MEQRLATIRLVGKSIRRLLVIVALQQQSYVVTSCPETDASIINAVRQGLPISRVSFLSENIYKSKYCAKTIILFPQAVFSSLL